MSDKEKTNGSLAMAPRVITIPAANQETARKLRVAAYTRVSSNSKDQEHSFAAQNAYFSKLITDNPDWELADIYADRATKALSFLRPHWWQDHEDHRALENALLKTQTLALKTKK